MTPRRVLLFYPSNKRSNVLETKVLELRRRGVEVQILTTCEAGPLHDYLAERGVPVYTHPIPKRNALIYYVRQIHHLARFCRRHRIDVVFSDLQHANFIAVFAQLFTSARVIAFRHHFHFVLPGDDIALGGSAMERWFDRVIHALAREVVVPSTGVYEGIAAHEGADMSRVRIIPYVYDFSRYGHPDPTVVEALRARYPARLRLLVSARMIPLKRHDVVLRVFDRLVSEGYDVALLVLDEGPERERLEAFVGERGLAERVAFLGFRRDFLEVMAASDVLVHPSLTEASSNVVKEMGYLGKPVIVCEGVGDFSDYLTHGVDAFLVPRDGDGAEIHGHLVWAYENPKALAAQGAALRETVLKRFGIDGEGISRHLELL